MTISKDGKTINYLQKKDEWEKLPITSAELEAMIQANGNTKPIGNFDKWIQAKKTPAANPATPASTTPAP